MQIVNADDFQAQNQNKLDETLLVKFYIKPLKDHTASLTEGRPIFIDTEYVEIRTPGSRDAVARPARPGDIARFPKHYEAFKNRTSQDVHDGTPLIEWPMVTRSQAEELGFFNVKTVEQLIAMPDDNASQFMGMQGLKTKAREWLEGAEETKKADALQAELKQRDNEIAELRAAIEELKAASTPTKRRVTKKKVTRKKASAKKE